jgi:Uma2 family endonuclease
MTAAKKLDLISVEEYLAGEVRSPIKHEYLGGMVHAMAGARNVHNAIATNLVAALHARLRGQKCRPFNSDTKVRIRLPTHCRFYYPDASVVCRPNPPEETFQDEPAILFEVLSEATRRIDGGEKRDAYLTISSLFAYVMLEQDSAAAVVYRRSEQGFVREVYTGTEAVIALAEIEIELPLAEVYEDVEFVPDRRDLDAEH